MVPSITELLFNIGAGDKIIGVTNYCKYPQNRVNKTIKVGGTKTINFNIVKNLNPDLIIAEKSENTKEQIIQLSEEYNIYIGDVYNYSSALYFIKTIGLILQLKTQNLIANINYEFSKIKPHTNKTCCYLIWNSPKITIGDNTFINDMITKIGFKNVFIKLKMYPTITNENILQANPEYIFLSSEPFLFTQKHQLEYQKKFPKSKIILVDGEMFSWYGSRMLLMPKYFKQLP